MSTILSTERLRLRPQTADDIDTIAAGLGDFDVARHLTVVPYPYTRQDAVDWVATLKPPRPEAGVFSIDLDGTGMIGTVTLANELGFWLARPYWGHGYMTEAARALLAWHFAETSADAVRSSAHVGNERSLAVQRKLGFVERGTNIRYVRPLNREIEHVETVLTRDAFAASQAGLR
jgi:RimJ/RimL family protein N-acetyltransferase